MTDPIVKKNALLPAMIAGLKNPDIDSDRISWVSGPSPKGWPETYKMPVWAPAFIDHAMQSIPDDQRANWLMSFFLVSDYQAMWAAGRDHILSQFPDAMTKRTAKSLAKSRLEMEKTIDVNLSSTQIYIDRCKIMCLEALHAGKLGEACKRLLDCHYMQALKDRGVALGDLKARKSVHPEIAAEISAEGAKQFFTLIGQ